MPESTTPGWEPLGNSDPLDQELHTDDWANWTQDIEENTQATASGETDAEFRIEI